MRTPHAEVAKARGLSARSLGLPMAIALFSACGLGRAGAQTGKAPLASAADAADVSGAADSDTGLPVDTTADTDAVGVCKDLTCTDDNPCTSDTCDPVKGCMFKPVGDGEPCGYQGKAICNSGTCAAKGCGKMGGLQMGAPWPMEGACPSHSRQSAYLGPQTAKVKWAFTDQDLADGAAWYGMTEAVVGTGDVVYFSGKMHVFAVEPKGDLMWKWKAAAVPQDFTSAAIGRDGTVFVGHDLAYVAVDQQGTLRWSLDMNGGTNSGPAIGPDGTLFVGTYDMHLAAYTPDGALKWQFLTDERVMSSPTIGADGLVYFGSLWKYFRALDQAGTEKWNVALVGAIHTSAVSGQDDRVYVTSTGSSEVANEPGRIYAFGRDPWQYVPTGNQQVRTWDALALADDGTVYHSTACLEAISPSGQNKWTFDDASAGAGCTPATIGADGTIYVAQFWARCTPPGGKGQPACHNDLYALNPDGSLKWHWQTPDKPSNGYSLTPPVLGANGTLYVFWTGGYLYAFAD